MSPLVLMILVVIFWPELARDIQKLERWFDKK
jgi:hypothetical protein